MGVVERRFFSSATSLRSGKCAEKCESRAGGPAKTVNGLVGIADGEDVPLLAGQVLKDLDLGKVGVLKFVHQNEAGVVAFARQQPRVVCQAGRGRG